MATGYLYTTYILVILSDVVPPVIVAVIIHVIGSVIIILVIILVIISYWGGVGLILNLTGGGMGLTHKGVAPL